MENLKVKVGYCPNCKGLKALTFVDIFPELNDEDFREEIEGDFGELIKWSKQEFHTEVKKFNLQERSLIMADVKEFSGSDCGCIDICYKIKSFDDACDYLGLDHKLPDYSFLPELLKVRMIALYKLIIITKALNYGDGPKTFVNDSGYYPVGFFNYSKEFPYKHHFGMTDCKFDDHDLGAGILMTFNNWGTAMYAGTQFRDLYLDYYQYPETYLNRYNNE